MKEQDLIITDFTFLPSFFAQLMNKIVESIGDKIQHKGFCHCGSNQVSPVSGIGMLLVKSSLPSRFFAGTFYSLLVAPSSSDDAIELCILNTIHKKNHNNTLMKRRFE